MKYNEFRRVSANYKQSKINTETYYKHFIAVFGTSPQASKLFEEMTDIMPDADKQSQLRIVYLKYKKLVRTAPVFGQILESNCFFFFFLER